MLSTSIHSIQAKALTIKKSEIEADKNYLCRQFTSLRPYITHGVMSLSQITSIVLAQNEFDDVEEFIKFLTWVEYCHKMWFEKLKENPEFDILNENISENKIKPENDGLPKAILDKNTGIKFIDERLKNFMSSGLLYNLHKEFITYLTTEYGKSDWKLLARWIYYNSLCDGIGVHSLTCQKACGALGFFERAILTSEKLEEITGDMNSDKQQIDLGKLTELFSTTVTEEDLEMQTIMPTIEELEKDDFFTLDALPDPDSFRNIVLHDHWNIDPTWYEGIDDLHILVLEPSHFEKYPVSKKRMKFILELVKNIIPSTHVFVGDFEELIPEEMRKEIDMNKIVSREHPTTQHWAGRREVYEWIASEINVGQKSFDEYFNLVVELLKGKVR